MSILRSVRSAIGVVVDGAREARRLLRDDPVFDATDGAHPAWWRGHDHAAKQLAKRVEDLVASEANLRSRLDLAMRQRAEELDREKKDSSERMAALRGSCERQLNAERAKASLVAGQLDDLKTERDVYRQRAKDHHERADHLQHCLASALREGLAECEALRAREVELRELQSNSLRKLREEIFSLNASIERERQNAKAWADDNARKRYAWRRVEASVMFAAKLCAAPADEAVRMIDELRKLLEEAGVRPEKKEGEA